MFDSKTPNAILTQHYSFGIQSTLLGYIYILGYVDGDI